MKKVKTIYQTQSTECGTCCISMMLKYYGIIKDITTLNIEIGLGRDGLSVAQIKNYLEMNDFSVKVYKCSVGALKNLTFPAIAYWENNHYVIIEKYSIKGVTINDPIDGRYVMAVEELYNVFKNVIVEAKPLYKPKNNIFLPSFIEAIRLAQISLKNIISVIGISLFAGLIMLIRPSLIQLIVDCINAPEYNDIPFIMFVFLLIYMFVNICDSFMKIKFGNNIFQLLTKKFMKKIMHVPFAFFQSNSESDLLFKINSIAEVEVLFTQKIIPIIFNMSIILILFIYLFWKSQVLSLLIFFGLICNGFIILLFWKKYNPLIQKSIRENMLTNNLTIEAIANIENIRMLSMEDDIYRQWEEQFLKFNCYNVKKNYLNVFFSSVVETFSLAIPLLILMVGVQYSKLLTLSFGGVMGIFSTAQILFDCETEMFGLVNEYNITKKYLESINGVLKQADQMNGTFKLKATDKVTVDLLHVNFSYSSNSPLLLKDINITAQAGKMIAIVGPTGSGKSTLLKLICGLLEKTEGVINFNGVDISNLDIQSSREVIGIVPQHIQLLNKTIYENITGGSEFELEEVIDICKIVGIDEDITQMPMKYNTILNNGGSNLSGGQKQKIALAKALLKKPVVLLLDEATSYLDGLSEKMITDEIEKRGCTRIVIAHRLSTVRNADYIYVLKNGEIIEEGKHENLYEKKGVYYDLYCESKKK